MDCFKVLTKKKVLDSVAISETQLARVLNTYDLTALGVGSTLGVGVYVLAGHVAREVAGPSVVLSFLIAAIASVFAGLCYAEFGSRIPRAGSAYVYSYVCVGELIAFITGWNLILQYVIGSASVARGLSLYLDTLINNTLQTTFREIAPINAPYMSTYFDFFSFGISVALAVALAIGMKNSSTVNTIFTVLNMLVVLFVIIAGSFKADPKNWSLPPPTNSTGDHGGFFPFGFSGMITGAATCFYGFVGFDCIATTGEEVKNPQKAIPIAIISSLAIIFLAYFGTATVLTLMVPYYLQDINAPIPHAFEMVGWNAAKWIVSIGGIFGLCASLFGSMFPLPRVIYAMASDGLIFKFLGKIHPKFQTPLIGTLLVGLLTGLMAALFDLKQLVNMMSIGTLLAYTIVAACVLLLRYASNDDRPYTLVGSSSESEIDLYAENECGSPVENSMSSDLLESDNKISCSNLMKQIFNYRKLSNPTKVSETLVISEIYLFSFLCLILGLCGMYLEADIMHGRWWAIILISTIGLLMILILMSISTQPNSNADIRFKVPLVPLIPALSILINTYLMLMLDGHTWIRFGVWMAVGIPMHFISVGLRCADKNSNSKVHAKVNGDISQTNKSNGHTNASFTADEEDFNEKKEDTHFIIPKPKFSYENLETPEKRRDSSVDSLSVNGALAALDEVLDKEEHAINTSFAYENAFSRKISIDTVSNVSNAHFVESVVALIHHEDVHDLEIPLPILEEVIENDSSSLNITNDSSSFYPPSIPPPPPPPLPPLLLHDSQALPFRLPRVSTEKIHSPRNSKIQKAISEPNIDTKKNYLSQDEVSDNITFGSKQHQNVVTKLNKLFERNNSGLPPLRKLSKPERLLHDEQQFEKKLKPPAPGMNHVFAVLSPKPSFNKTKENSNFEGVVVEEALKPADIKKKLNELLRSDRLVIDKSTLVNVNNKIEREKEKDDSRSLHQELMNDTLQSIRLRKKSSLKSDS